MRHHTEPLTSTLSSTTYHSVRLGMKGVPFTPTGTLICMSTSQEAGMKKALRSVLLTSALVCSNVALASGGAQTQGGCWSYSLGPIFITNCF